MKLFCQPLKWPCAFLCQMATLELLMALTLTWATQIVSHLVSA